MKTITLLSLSLVSTWALAQHRSISSNTHDNGKKMSISIHGTIDGRPIDYERTFDVEHLSKTERIELRTHILDSLGLEAPKPPVPPTPPTAPTSPAVPTPPVPPTELTLESSADRPTVSSKSGHHQTEIIGGDQPFVKEVKYSPESGQLFVRYRFMKNGEEVLYERTLNAPNKSAQERQKIVDSIEKELELPTKKK